MISTLRLTAPGAPRLSFHGRLLYRPRNAAFASSLSAIHRGIHRSDPGAHRTRATRTEKRRPKSTPYDRRGSDARDRLSTTPSAKDIRAAIAGEHTEFSTGKQTRRKRFHDPASSFGKNSLVYRMKFGDLKNKADSILTTNQRSHEEARVRASHRGPRAEASSQSSRHGSREDAVSDRRRHRPEERHISRARAEGPDANDDLESSAKRRGSKKSMHPISVKYTTAASQFLFGKSVVKAALAMGKRKFYNLYILEGERREQDSESLKALVKKNRVPVTLVKDAGKALMDKMSGGRPHNGYVLEASPLPQLPISSLGPLIGNPWRPAFAVTLGRQSAEEEAINGTSTIIHYENRKLQKPLVLLLNEVLDPGNVGALLRTARFLGVSAVAMTKQGSASLTPVVLKASAGAVEEIPLFTVDSAIDFITASKAAGWRSYAAAPLTSRKDARKVTLDQVEKQNPLSEAPCILILGSEGQGLPWALRRESDFEVSIPGTTLKTSVDSLNVSVAGGVLCNAFLKLRQPEKREAEAATHAQSSSEVVEEQKEDEKDAEQDKTKDKETEEGLF